MMETVGLGLDKVWAQFLHASFLSLGIKICPQIFELYFLLKTFDPTLHGTVLMHLFRHSFLWLHLAHRYRSKFIFKISNFIVTLFSSSLILLFSWTFKPILVMAVPTHLWEVFLGHSNQKFSRNFRISLLFYSLIILIL